MSATAILSTFEQFAVFVPVRPRFSLLRYIHLVVIWDPIYKLIYWIDSCPRRQLIHRDIERLLCLGNLLFLQIQRLLVILLPTEHTDIDVISERHHRFIPTA